MILEENLPRDFKGVFIPKDIYLNNKLSSTEKILYAEIDSLFNYEKGGCFASNEYLSKFLGVKERIIRQGISKLKQFGYVNQVAFNGRERILLALMPGREAKKCRSEVQDSAGLLPIIDNKKDDIHIAESWKTNFSIYQREEEEAYNQLLKDEPWLQGQEKYKKYPGINILKSLEKAHVTFWSTEEGWKCKKKGRAAKINWKSTYTKALGMSFNYIYDPRNNDNSETDAQGVEKEPEPTDPWKRFLGTSTMNPSTKVENYLIKIWERTFGNQDYKTEPWYGGAWTEDWYKKAWEMLSVVKDKKQAAEIFDKIHRLFEVNDEY